MTVKWGKEGVGKGAAGWVGVIYAVKVYLAGGLLLKKKVLRLMIGWVVWFVILNHLGVIHL